ncbi:hypothetical protein SAMN05216257_101113 [Meinhardsimonia xiamenensis]|jgi:SAM-dependent methyltransferase|uniref:Methyltransferase domain-containing protein n=1 Tax=Meinhardsimonia xiamenensis TaxID=990712 RepID=A0A1G8XYF4_9RHOB|nr:SAM-dependent methyltransferase [Meinhardsimonia xiamenensis]PRX37095.1 hypothetical protein LV81_00869 [Meinhardsimonia xiamenensis]SDJ95568.1 hypothetical protein SAMN05216257_101113 [Meinhardsimonia xiamenensis]
MTHSPPQLVDRAALARHRARAAAMAEPALFLHDYAAGEIKERLALVNRAFTAPAVVTGFPAPWSARFPAARVVPDDEILTLEPAAHDLVIHGLALHWANDPVGQLIQCLRALKPDGLFLGILFGGRTLTELRAALLQAEIALTGGASPRVAPMGEIRDLGTLLQRAGFALPVADAIDVTVEYPDALALMRDLRAMGETNALAQRHRRTPPRALFTTAAELYARAHARPGGRIPATFEMVVLTGWAPHPSQQKPLRPGSAAQRLADALGTVERRPGDMPTD